MAKRKQYEVSEKLDTIIYNGYRNGVWQSCVIHTIVLLILAVLVNTKPAQTKPIVLHFENASNIEISEVDIRPLDVDISSLVSESTGDTKEENLPMIISPVSEDIGIEQPKIVEQVSFSKSEKEPVSIKTLLSKVSETSDNDHNEDNAIDISSNILGVGQSDGSMDGSGDKIGARLAKAGAQTGDIQVSISWDNTNDIDLWIDHKNNKYVERVGWLTPQVASGGWLDVDMNAHPHLLTNEAVENIFWPFNHGDRGVYVVSINFFRQWDNNNATPVDIRIVVGKKTINKRVILRRPGEFIKVHTFRF